MPTNLQIWGIRRWLVTVLAALFITGCRSPQEILPGEGPVQQFTRREKWLSVYAGIGAKRGNLLNIEMLAPFQPGSSPGAAMKLYGNPDRVIPRERGAEYVEYLRPQGRFRLGFEESADGHVAYPLYFYPNDRRPAALFPSLVVNRLRAGFEEEVVMFFECGFNQPFIHVVLSGGQIDRVIWLSDDELGRRQSREQCTE